MRTPFIDSALLAVAVIGVIVGLLFLGSSNSFEANLGVGLFVIGGVSGTRYLSAMIEAKKKSSL
jgi:hypothetical protein